MLEAKLLIDCVKQVQELAGLTKDNGSNNGMSPAGTGSENSGLNRVLIDTEKLIEQLQVKSPDGSEEIT